jgi:hypothetical protein
LNQKVKQYQSERPYGKKDSPGAKVNLINLLNLLPYVG